MAADDRPDALTPRERRAVVATLTARTLDEAAAEVGVSPRTLRRWREREPFRRAVREAARDADRDAVDSLRAAAVAAVGVLRTSLGDPSAAVRLRAACAILDAAERARDHDLVERLDALEAAFRARLVAP